MHTSEKHSDDDEESVEKIMQPKEVSVNIYYPCPKSSSLTHNAKYLQPTSDTDEYNYHQRKLSPKSKKEKRKMSRKHFAVDDFFDELYDDFSEEEYEDSDDELSQYIFSHPLRKDKSSFTAEDVLKQAAKMQELCRNSTASEQNNEIKKENKTLIYLPRSHADVPEVANDANETPILLRPLREKVPDVKSSIVFLQRREITPEYLQFVHGENYIECACIPRSFIIDISDAVKDSIRGSKGLRHLGHRIDFASSLIFTYEMSADIEDGALDAFSVSVNAKLKVPEIKMKYIVDSCETAVEEIIQRVCAYYLTLSVSAFCLLPKIPVNSLKTNFETLQQSQDAKVENYHVSQRKFFKEMIDGQGAKIKAENKAVSPTKPSLCHICYDAISNDNGRAFCLETCGHWFCDTCWREHMLTGLDNNIRELTCPEYGCKSHVESSFMLLLLNVRIVDKFVSLRHDSFVEESRRQKWCPNPSCGRVLTVSKDAKCLNVSCACGAEICFDCLQPAHWPATCEQSVAYWKTLKKNGQDVDFDEYSCKTFIVKGKRCPKCDRFIEKLGGCFYMTCVCGANFCWGCRGLYPGHIETKDCNQHVVGDSHNNVKEKVRHIVRKDINEVSAMYRNAVINRVGRMKTRYSKLKGGNRKLMKRCGEISRSSEVRLRDILQDIQVPGNENPTTTEKIRALLSSIMSMYIEMRYLAEYTSVYVQQSADLKAQKLSNLKEIVQMLDGFAGDIFNLMCKTEEQDLMSVICELCTVRAHSKNTVTGLVKIMSR